MRIAVASGKGGTGKTTVATSLAYVAASNGHTVTYVDCDVEEPNGHIFLEPAIEHQEAVTTSVPKVDADRCTLCAACSDLCQFRAIACLGKRVMVFPELCHACGGCSWVCPQQAIEEVPREVASLEWGHAGAVAFAHARLNIGEAKSPPVIRAVKEAAPAAELTILDAPPGTACPVVETVHGCDFVVLVTEPTPFGLHDLELAVDMAGALKLRCGVVANRAGFDDEALHRVCDKHQIPILAAIPDERRIAEAYSLGTLACQVSPDHETLFRNLLAKIVQCARRPQEEPIRG